MQCGEGSRGRRVGVEKLRQQSSEGQCGEGTRGRRIYVGKAAEVRGSTDVEESSEVGGSIYDCGEGNRGRRIYVEKATEVGASVWRRQQRSDDLCGEGSRGRRDCDSVSLCGEGANIRERQV